MEHRCYSYEIAIHINVLFCKSSVLIYFFPFNIFYFETTITSVTFQLMLRFESYPDFETIPRNSYSYEFFKHFPNYLTKQEFLIR